MDVIVERPGALDVHKASVTACLRTPAEGGRRDFTSWGLGVRDVRSGSCRALPGTLLRSRMDVCAVPSDQSRKRWFNRSNPSSESRAGRVDVGRTSAQSCAVGLSKWRRPGLTPAASSGRSHD
jgi:hypothetical protein